MGRTSFFGIALLMGMLAGAVGMPRAAAETEYIINEQIQLQLTMLVHYSFSKMNQSVILITLTVHPTGSMRDIGFYFMDEVNFNHYCNLESYSVLYTRVVTDSVPVVYIAITINATGRYFLAIHHTVSESENYWIQFLIERTAEVLFSYIQKSTQF